MSSYLLFCCIYFDAWFITCCPKREETLKVYRVIAYICYIYFDAWCITCCSKREETLEVYRVIGKISARSAGGVRSIRFHTEVTVALITPYIFSNIST